MLTEPRTVNSCQDCVPETISNQQQNDFGIIQFVFQYDAIIAFEIESDSFGIGKFQQAPINK